MPENRLFLMTSLGVLASVGTQPAIAAQEGATVAQADDGGIIVTARRREERLQDVPVAVTVISGDALQSQNLQSMTEFQRKIPSMTITPVNGRGVGAAISIRGQRQGEIGVAADPSVAVYINEVTSARPTGLDTTVYDLESVQVLKGPQGTLFGRNSTGGAMLITTRKPGENFGGYVRGYVEDPNATGIEGALNIPVNSAIRIRLAGNYQYREGYSFVVNTRQHLDDRNRYALRGTLDIEPLPGLRSTFVVDYFQADENGLATYAFNYRPGLIFEAPQTSPASAASGAALPPSVGYPDAYAEAQSLGFHRLATSAPAHSSAKSFSVTNTTTWELNDALTLKNVAGYRYLRANDILDADGTRANVNFFNAFVGGRQYSEELQLQGTAFGDALNWIVGGYYFEENGYDDVQTYTFRAPLVGGYSNNRFSAVNRSLSAFANMTYTLPFESRTRISGGIRYTRDEREIVWSTRSVAANGAATCLVAGATNDDCAKAADVSFKKVTWLAGLDHEFTPGAMGYVTVSSGYRAGGFNGRATSLATQIPYDPETLVNYELGLKSNFDLGGAPVMFNIAGYYSDYKDIQRTVTANFAPPGAPAIPVSTIVNAASATVKGFEIEASVRPSRDVEVTGRYSYVSAKYKNFFIFSPRFGQELDVSDNRFRGVSPHQWGTSFAWTFLRSDSGGNVKFMADLSYADGFELDDINLSGNRSDDNAVVNASIGWDDMFGSRASATFYVKNLFNEKYILSGLPLTAAFDISTAYHSAPRVIGLSLKLPFGGE
ncbi:MAG: TonB-dependent receptor plug domain-containing protein [Sphingobium sp.]